MGGGRATGWSSCALPPFVGRWFEGIVVPGSIDACVHRLPNGKWRMWFKNERKKIHGTVLDSDDLRPWQPTRSQMPDPDPGKGEGPDVLFLERLGFDGTTLTCDRDAEFTFQLKPPQPEFTQEHVPSP